MRRFCFCGFAGAEETKLEDISKLKEDRVFKLRTCQAIVEKAKKDNDRELSDEEKHEIKELRAEAQVLETRIKKLEEDEAIRRQVSADLDALNQVETRKTAPIQPETAARPRIEVLPHYGNLRAFENTVQGRETAHRMGMWAAASIFGLGWAKRWCRDNNVELRVLSEGSNASGGALVPDEMSMRIIDLREKYGVFRQNVRIEPMGSDTKIVPRRTGGMTAYFAGEGGSGTESDPSWDSIQLVAKKLVARTRMSAEVNEDSVINLADTLTNEIAYAFALKEDTVGFTGTGISTDGGVTGVAQKFNDTPTLKGAVAAAAGHDTFAEIDAGDLAKVMATLPEYAAMNAKWYCSRVAAQLIFGRLMQAAGGNTMGDLAGAIPSNYLGYPIVVSQVLTKVTTALNATAMLLFGDLSMAATLGARRDITIGLTDQRYWEEDQIGIKGTERLDIVVHDVGSETAAGPIVALMGNTN